MSEKKRQMEALWEEVRCCTRCPISGQARNKVFGDGNVSAKICLVGEAPGMDEDRAGHAFIGNAGRILTTCLWEAGIDRREVFIHNALKCHPGKLDPEGNITGNRKPTAEELDACRPFLYRQISIVRPKIIVALGGSALKALTGVASDVGIMRSFGLTVPFSYGDCTAVIVVSLHPQYIGYNEGDRDLKARYIDLFRQIKEWSNRVRGG